MLAAWFEDSPAFIQVAPFENVEGDAAHAPVFHGGVVGFVEIDGVASGQSPAVVIDFIDFARGDDLKNCAHWPARPIGGGTVDGAGAKRGAEGVARTVFAMILFSMRVGSGAYFLDIGAGQGTFVIGQGTSRTSDQAKKDKAE